MDSTNAQVITGANSSGMQSPVAPAMSSVTPPSNPANPANPASPMTPQQGAADDTFTDNPAFVAPKAPQASADDTFSDNPAFKSTTNDQSQPGLFSRAYETSGAKGIVDLAKKTIITHPIDLYMQSVDAMKAGDWKTAVMTAGKLYSIIPDKDSPLAQAAQEIIRHPIDEAKAAFKENRKKGQNVVESAVNATPIGAVTDPQRLVQGVHDTAQKAIEDAKGGNISGAVGDVLTAPLTSHVAGEIPILGGAAQDIGTKLNEDLHNHNYAAVTGDVVGPLLTLGIGKAVGAFGEAGEGAEAAEGTEGAGLPTGVKPGSVDIAGEKVPVAATHPQLETQSSGAKILKGQATPEGAKQFVREQVQPAAVRATQSNFSQSALQTADKLREIRGEDLASDTAPALHTVSDISNFLKKEAKGTYSKLDNASEQEVADWEAQYGKENQQSQQPASTLLGPDGRPISQAATPKVEIPPKPKTFEQLQDQINNAEDTLKNRGASQVDKGQAKENLPLYNQEMQDFLSRHNDIVSEDELNAADNVHRAAKQYEFIDKRMRTVTKGTPAGKIFKGETPYFNTKSLENLEGQFDNKYGEGSFKNLLGEDGYHNFNDILNALKNPATGSYLQEWLKKAPLHTGEFAEMPVQRVADNLLFNPTAGQTFLKMFRSALDSTKAAGKVAGKVGVAAAPAVQKPNRIFDAAKNALGGGSQ